MSKRTKTILIAVAALVVIAAAVWLIFFRGNGTPANDVNASGESGSATAESTEGDKNVLPEKLVVGTEGNWAPWTYHDLKTNELVGFDVEVARAVADKLGTKLEFAEVEWSAILAGVETGRYTTAANGFGITEERKKTYDFSDPYAYSVTVLIVRSDNTEVTTFEDLKGRKTANSASSTYMALGEKYGASVTSIEALADTMNEVILGRADATINSLDSFNDYMKEQPDAPLKVVAVADEKTPVGFPFHRNTDPELVKKINQAIAELRADGTLKSLSEKYFGMDITAE